MVGSLKSPAAAVIVADEGLEKEEEEEEALGEMDGMAVE